VTILFVATIVVAVGVAFTVAGTYALVVSGSGLRWALAYRRRRLAAARTPRAVARIRRSVA
jgi:hypothetical protein